MATRSEYIGDKVGSSSNVLEMLKARLAMWERTWPELKTKGARGVPESVLSRVDELSVMIDNIERPVPRCTMTKTPNGPRCLNAARPGLSTCGAPDHYFERAEPSDRSFVAADGTRYTSLMDFLLMSLMLVPHLTLGMEDELRDAIERYTDAVCERQADSDIHDEDTDLRTAVALLERIRNWDPTQLSTDAKAFLEQPYIKTIRKLIHCHCGAYVVGTPGTKAHQRDRCDR